MPEIISEDWSEHASVSLMAAGFKSFVSEDGPDDGSGGFPSFSSKSTLNLSNTMVWNDPKC